MSVYIAEYGGFRSGRDRETGIPTEPLAQLTVYSSAATSTGFLLEGTALVEMTSLGVNAWILFTSSTGSTTIATSTNALLLPANVPVRHYVPQCFSTVTPGSFSTGNSGGRYTILSS